MNLSLEDDNNTIEQLTSCELVHGTSIKKAMNSSSNNGFHREQNHFTSTMPASSVNNNRSLQHHLISHQDNNTTAKNAPINCIKVDLEDGLSSDDGFEFNSLK